ncbi:PAS domain-containing sensor histidine kinase [Candidatus Saccharibacteria bacterium]|nr:PAS domain-containing sensor histidine kinase [Candidatus Saccharibacteria bacterium]
MKNYSKISLPLMHNLTELVPGMVALYNIRTGEYIYVNQSIKKILGYSPNDFMEKGIEFVASLVHPIDLPKIIKKNDEALKRANSVGQTTNDSDPIVSFEYRMLHKNGSWVWLHTDGMVYSRTSKGKVEQIVNVSMDITKRKKTEEDLLKLTTELVALNTSKDEFVAITSHQLRTPATAVKQYLGLLLEGYTDKVTEGQKVFLDLAYENNERQLHIVDEILKITQLDLDKVQLRPKIVNISKVVDEAVDALQNNFRSKQQKIFIKKPPSIVKAFVDVEHLRTAIENTLENASQYSYEGRKIAVTLEDVESVVNIKITDEGVGIDSSDFSKLFQKFSRIPNPLSVEAGGTGLGLYWARKVVQLHKGDITVESKVGKGSSFTISIPKKNKASKRA